MEVGLTGATGFLGSRLLPLLREHNLVLTTVSGEKIDSRLSTLDSSENDQAGHDSPNTKVDIRTIEADLSSESPPAEFYDNLDVLVHMVGSFSPDPKAMTTLNLASLMYVLAPLEKLEKKPRVVFTSSCAVYGETPEGTANQENDALEPSTPYGFAKLWCEQYLAWHSQRNEYETTVVRFPNIYGVGSQAVMAKFIERLAAGQPVQLDGDGGQVRDFLHVDDAATGIAKAITAGNSDVFNISTGVETTLRELLALLGNIMKIEPQIESRPVNPFTQNRIVLNPRKAKEQLGWEPAVALADGIRKVLNG